MKLLAALIVTTVVAMGTVSILSESSRAGSTEEQGLREAFLIYSDLTGTMEVCANGSFREERQVLADRISEWTYPSRYHHLTGQHDVYRADLVAESTARRDSAFAQGCKVLPGGGEPMRRMMSDSLFAILNQR